MSRSWSAASSLRMNVIEIENVTKSFGHFTVMVLIMAPFFVWTSVLEAPSATFSVVISLIPPATPMLMLLRQGIPPGVPIWQPILGIVGVLLTTVLIVFAAGRVFRIGILMQGKGAKISDMLRWALRG